MPFSNFVFTSKSTQAENGIHSCWFPLLLLMHALDIVLLGITWTSQAILSHLILQSAQISGIPSHKERVIAIEEKSMCAFRVVKISRQPAHFTGSYFEYCAGYSECQQVSSEHDIGEIKWKQPPTFWMEPPTQKPTDNPATSQQKHREKKTRYHPWLRPPNTLRPFQK